MVSLEDMPNEIHAENLWVYLSPVILLIGTLGNGLVIFVLTRKAMRSSMSSIYLICLAVSDFCVLYTGLLRQWIRRLGIWNGETESYTYTDVRVFSDTGCRFHLFMVYYSLHMSAWILICFTVERVVAVYFPLKSKRICSRLTVIACVASTAILLFILNGHFFWTYKLEILKIPFHPLKEFRFCRAKDEEFPPIWRKIHMWVGSFVPFIIMLMLNGLIVIKLFLLKHKSTVKSTKGISATSTTITLFGVTLMFLIFTAPLALHLAFGELWYEALDVPTVANKDLHFAIVNMFQYLNSALNFILYSLTSPKFRREVTSLFCKKCVKSNAIGAFTAGESTVKQAATGTTHA